MDAYIDVVSGEIRALHLPEGDSDHDNGESKKKNFNRPLPFTVAIMCALASCTLATCWIAVTCDVLKMLKNYGPHSMLFMQLAYNLPVLPIVVMQKRFGPSICRYFTTKGFVVIQALLAYVGLGLMCTKWDYIMREFVDGDWFMWGLCWLFVGFCSATGYGAFLFLVRLFDNRSKLYFVRGFNCGSFLNLIVLCSTGGPLFSMKNSDEDSDFAYYQVIGGIVWFGLTVVVLTLIFVPEISERMKEHDEDLILSNFLKAEEEDVIVDNPQHKSSNLELRMKNLNSNAPQNTSPPSLSPTSRNGGDSSIILTANDLTLTRTLSEYAIWPLAYQTMVSFTLSIATFGLIPYIPSSNCFLPLKLTYISIFCDVLGQYIPTAFLFKSNVHDDDGFRKGIRCEQTMFVGSILISRLLLFILFLIMLTLPISRSFNENILPYIAAIIIGLTAALGSMLSKYNFERVSTACANGNQIAPSSSPSSSSSPSTSKLNTLTTSSSFDDNDSKSKYELVGGDGGVAVRQGISAISLFVFIGCYIGFGLGMLLIYFKLKRGWKYDIYDNPGEKDGYPDWFKPTCSTRQASTDAFCAPYFLFVGC